MISLLVQGVGAIEHANSDHYWASKPTAHFGIGTPPTLLGAVAKPGTGTAVGRARELLRGPKTAPIPLRPPSASSHEPAPTPQADLTSSLARIGLERRKARSSTEVDFGIDGAPAQSEEGYAGMVMDGAGASAKMGGRALLERIRRTREEHPEIILAAHENAVKRGAPGEAWLRSRHAYDEVLPPQTIHSRDRISLGEGRSGNLPRQQALLWQIYTVCESARDPSHDMACCWRHRRRRRGSRSGSCRKPRLMCLDPPRVAKRVTVVPFQSWGGWGDTFNCLCRTQGSKPICQAHCRIKLSVVGVGSRCLMAGHVLGAAEASSVTCWSSMATDRLFALV